MTPTGYDDVHVPLLLYLLNPYVYLPLLLYLTLYILYLTYLYTYPSLSYRTT